MFLYFRTTYTFFKLAKLTFNYFNICQTCQTPIIPQRQSPRQTCVSIWANSANIVQVAQCLFRSQLLLPYSKICFAQPVQWNQISLISNFYSLTQLHKLDLKFLFLLMMFKSLQIIKELWSSQLISLYNLTRNRSPELCLSVIFNINWVGCWSDEM